MATSLTNATPHTVTSMPTPSQTILPMESSARLLAPTETPPPAPANSPKRLALTALATVVMLAALFLLQGCGRGDDDVADAAAAPVVIEAGQLPVANAEVAATIPPAVYAAGQVVTGAQALAVYPDAAAGGPVLEVYEGGAAFTVLEPGLDKSAYPVVADGASWVRVRAGDGLAGWVNAAALTQ